MLPNRFPDEGTAPEYNTADATLWLFHALGRLSRGDTRSGARARALPGREVHHSRACAGHALRHRRRPRRRAAARGRAGRAAHLDGREARRPRVHAADRQAGRDQCAVAECAAMSPRVSPDRVRRRRREALLRGAAGACRSSFQPLLEPGAATACTTCSTSTAASGTDAAIRPNQLFAVSLPYSALAADADARRGRCLRPRAVDELRAAQLEPEGSRATSAATAATPGSATAAYHQGTVWAWLLGPFARAHYRVHGDARLAQSFLDPIAEHLRKRLRGLDQRDLRW